MELFRNTDIFPITNLSLSTLFFKSIMLCLVAFFLPYNNSSSTLYAAQMEQAFLSEMSTCNHNISATTITSIDTSCTDTPQIFHVAITGYINIIEIAKPARVRSVRRAFSVSTRNR